MAKTARKWKANVSLEKKCSMKVGLPHSWMLCIADCINGSGLRLALQYLVMWSQCIFLVCFTIKCRFWLAFYSPCNLFFQFSLVSQLDRLQSSTQQQQTVVAALGMHLDRLRSSFCMLGWFCLGDDGADHFVMLGSVSLIVLWMCMLMPIACLSFFWFITVPLDFACAPGEQWEWRTMGNIHILSIVSVLILSMFSRSCMGAPVPPTMAEVAVRC